MKPVWVNERITFLDNQQAYKMKFPSILKVEQISGETSLSHISDDNIFKVHQQTITQSLEVVTSNTRKLIYSYIK